MVVPYADDIYHSTLLIKYDPGSFSDLLVYYNREENLSHLSKSLNITLYNLMTIPITLLVYNIHNKGGYKSSPQRRSRVKRLAA